MLPHRNGHGPDTVGWIGVAPAPDTRVVRPRPIVDRLSRPRDVVGWGLEVSLRGFLQNQLIQREISHGSLQTGILSFQILEPFRLIQFEASIFLAPARVRGVGDIPLPADVFDCLPLSEEYFRFAEFVNDLFDGEFNAWNDTLLKMSQACNIDLGVV